MEKSDILNSKVGVMKRCAVALCMVLSAALMFLPCGNLSARAQDGVELNRYGSLNLATQIVKIGDEYFIEDGYNGQIIYSSDLCAPLSEWKVMASGIDRGHSVAGCGKYYLIDDTDGNRFIAYEREGDKFTVTATFDTGSGSRPHYVLYDEVTRKFYGLVSMTGEIYVFEVGSLGVQLQRKMKADLLDGVYVRSFSVIDGEIYFVSGNNNIIRASMDDLKAEESIPVPNIMRSMTGIMKAGDYFYISVSGESAEEQNRNAALLRTESLKGLISYDFENVTHYFGEGVPYYMSAFDGKYYAVMQAVPGAVNTRIFEFATANGEIVNVRNLF